MKDEYDFGFSLVSEEELKKHEEHLTVQTQIISNKLELIQSMIMPLLNNLKQDPEKEYIYWPNRQEKIEEFILKVKKIAFDYEPL